MMLSAALAQAGCTAGTEEVPPLCPTHLPRVRSVVIERSGARAYAEPGSTERCGGFRPTAAQVTGFLGRARRTDAASADATLDRSPCYAEGRVRFADGRRARWRIEQLRVGTLTFAGKPPMLLFCDRCHARPFTW